MAGSFAKIDYRLRPAKHAERSMLCELFRRMRFCKPHEYQYVGFGSVAFVDFRMVHRALGLTKMISIEDARSKIIEERFDKNKPFESIELIIGNSATALPQIDFGRRSLVWLDFDDAFNGEMVTDLRMIASNLDSGSFLGFTFSNSVPFEGEEAEAKVLELGEQFPDYVDDTARISDFSGGKIAEFARTIVTDMLNEVLSKADAGKPLSARRFLKQVCYFKYSDNASMTTLGWVVVSNSELEKLKECDLEGLDFAASGDAPFKITVPKITPHELRELEKFIPTKPGDDELAWIPVREKNAFFEAYRYLPNFGVIESV